MPATRASGGLPVCSAVRPAGAPPWLPSPLFLTQAAAAVMGAGGWIVLTSSVSARVAVFEHSLYAASKPAVSALVLNLAPELAQRGIAINAIAPGGTRTGMAAAYGDK